MKPVIALVGRPNVGKSTLFNRLTHGRDALVADFPGLTRDRQYGSANISGRHCTLIDTGGLGGEAAALTAPMESQALQAVAEADLVLFLVDARSGVTASDEELAARLRRQNRPLVLVVNKIDGVNQELLQTDFMGLGFPHQVAISAAHNRGMKTLYQVVADCFPAPPTEPENEQQAAAPKPSKGELCVAVVGRPNVGKSTLINRMLGEDRQVVFDQPGTTRDSIAVSLERQGTHYRLVDTAGVRRKGRVTAGVEKFSIVKTLEALERAQVAILLIDATEGLVDQDLHLLSYSMEMGTALVLVVNKWDGLSQQQKANTRASLARKLAFAPWLSSHMISALHGSGVGKLFGEIEKVHRLAAFDVNTAQLTRILTQATQRHAPPAVRGRRIKLRYAHKIGEYPPRIAIHGHQTDSLPRSYVRYLENFFRAALALQGVPLFFSFKTAKNPYADKTNTLTPRQQRRRKKMVRHAKLSAKSRKRR